MGQLVATTSHLENCPAIVRAADLPKGNDHIYWFLADKKWKPVSKKFAKLGVMHEVMIAQVCGGDVYLTHL